MVRNAWKILGVPCDDNLPWADVRKVYLQRAIELHPDKAGPENVAEATAKFQDLHWAYTQLEVHYRGRADRTAAAAQPAPQPQPAQHPAPQPQPAWQPQPATQPQPAPQPGGWAAGGAAGAGAGFAREEVSYSGAQSSYSQPYTHPYPPQYSPQGAAGHANGPQSCWAGPGAQQPCGPLYSEQGPQQFPPQYSQGASGAAFFATGPQYWTGTGPAGWAAGGAAGAAADPCTHTCSGAQPSYSQPYTHPYPPQYSPQGAAGHANGPQSCWAGPGAQQPCGPLYAQQGPQQFPPQYSQGASGAAFFATGPQDGTGTGPGGWAAGGAAGAGAGFAGEAYTYSEAQPSYSQPYPPQYSPRGAAGYATGSQSWAGPGAQQPCGPLYSQPRPPYFPPQVQPGGLRSSLLRDWAPGWTGTGPGGGAAGGAAGAAPPFERDPQPYAQDVLVDPAPGLDRSARVCRTGGATAASASAVPAAVLAPVH